MKVEKPHGFSPEEALARMQALTDYWKKHGVNSEWSGNVGKLKGKVKGFSFEGEIIVGDVTIKASVKANLVARKVGGAYVEGKIKDYLNKSISLEELQARVPKSA
jgi:hypothetical protein